MIFIQKVHAEANNDLHQSSMQIMPFYWMIVIVGGLNLFTLLYVGWKKYRAEKEKSRKQDINN